MALTGCSVSWSELVSDSTVAASGGYDFNNPVFDVYFHGNNEGVYMGKGTDWNGNPLDEKYQKKLDWGDSNPYTDNGFTEESLKSAIMSGINRWTDAITNRLDKGQTQKLKIAVQFGTDSSSLLSGIDAVAQFSAIGSRKTKQFAEDNGYNMRTVVEAYLRDGDTQFLANTGTYNVVASQGCVDVVLSLNLDRAVKSLQDGGVDINAGVSALVTHELGHAFGFSSSLYGPTSDGLDMLIDNKTSDLTKWDSMLYTRNQDGTLSRLATLDVLTGNLIPGKYVLAGSDGTSQTLDLASANALSKIGGQNLVLSADGVNALTVYNPENFFIPGSSAEHLFILDGEGYTHDIMSNYSLSTIELSQNDLAVLGMLGYTLKVPEPSAAAFGLFSLGFCLLHRRRP